MQGHLVNKQMSKKNANRGRQLGKELVACNPFRTLVIGLFNVMSFHILDYDISASLSNETVYNTDRRASHKQTMFSKVHCLVNYYNLFTSMCIKKFFH